MYSPTGEEKWVTEKTINQFISMGYTLCPTCEPRMSYAVPEWVPQDPEEKVLLLLDDYSRMTINSWRNSSKNKII